MTADPPPRPTREQIQGAYGAVVPDLLAPDLAVLLCGINPSLTSGAMGLHFATPGNRLWPVLHTAGWTTTQLKPWQTAELLATGVGITNLVPRATARADQLTDDELRAGLPRLTDLAQHWRPQWVAFLGLTAYRTATGRRTAAVGRQPERIGPAGVWLLPNPSGLNASWQLPRLAEAYAELRAVAVSGGSGRRAGGGVGEQPGDTHHDHDD